jgi:hypothetical protein
MLWPALWQDTMRLSANRRMQLLIIGISVPGMCPTAKNFHGTLVHVSALQSSAWEQSCLPTGLALVMAMPASHCTCPTLSVPCCPINNVCAGGVLHLFWRW